MWGLEPSRLRRPRFQVLILLAVLSVLVQDGNCQTKHFSELTDCTKNHIMTIIARACSVFKRSTVSTAPEKQYYDTRRMDSRSLDDGEDDILMGFTRVGTDVAPTTTTTAATSTNSARRRIRRLVRSRRVREARYLRLINRCCSDEGCTLETYPHISELCMA